MYNLIGMFSMELPHYHMFLKLVYKSKLKISLLNNDSSFSLVFHPFSVSLK